MAMKRLGFLNSVSSSELETPVAEFHRGLKQAGFVAGENVEIIDRWAEHDLEKLPGLAADLLQEGVDVLAATGGLVAAQAAVATVKKAKKSTRIVFVGGFDPVKSKLVKKLHEPKGTVTGVNTTTTESLPQRLKLFRELVGKTPIDLVTRADAAVGMLERKKSGKIPVIEVRSVEQLRQRIQDAKKKSHALVLSSDPFFTTRAEEIAQMAKEIGVPAVYAWRAYVDAGGLMSYGPSLPNAYRQAGVYAGHILANAKAPNPPVIQLNCCELVINLDAAEDLGIEVPRSLLAQASHIVD
jgi:putative ABC transport system substrate-binding protein